MPSKEASEDALLAENNGRYSILCANIKQVYFLPLGDKWQVSKAGSLSIISSTQKRLTQTIGVDKTKAIQEAERELDSLRRELRDADDQLSKVKRDRDEFQRNWNAQSKKLKANDADIKKLENDIDELKAEAEAAQNFTAQDTSDLEDEVKAAEEACQALKEKETESRKALEALEPAAQVIQRSLDEIAARNKKVVADMNEAEKKLEELVRGQKEKIRTLDKKRAKLDEAENAIKIQREAGQEKAKKNDETRRKARTANWKYDKSLAERDLQTDEKVMSQGSSSDEPSEDELADIEPMKLDREPDFYKSKITRTEGDIEKEKRNRNLSEKDPEVAYEKYQRAKKDLDSKLLQIERIERNVALLKKDLKSRRKMWKRFRSHICDMTSTTFDEILNKKGSSGQIEFNHENKELNLMVQKDNRNAMTQTSDVKALRFGLRIVYLHVHYIFS